MPSEAEIHALLERKDELEAQREDADEKLDAMLGLPATHSVADMSDADRRRLIRLALEGLRAQREDRLAAAQEKHRGDFKEAQAFNAIKLAGGWRP